MFQVLRIRNTLLAAASLLGLGQAWAEPVYSVGLVPVPTMPGSESYGAAINNTGKTGAQVYQAVGGLSSFRCGAASCKQIYPLSDQHHAGNYINGIDDAGNVVGTSPYLYFERAFRFDGKKTENIGFGDGPDLESTGEGINNVGMLVGSTETLDHKTRAFVWDNGSLSRLGTLGGDDSYGYGINDRGDVVGWAQLANGDQHAFLQRAGATMRDLGTLGGTSSEARAINQARQVVGCSKTAGDATEEAFIYAAGLMQGLPTLGGTSACAYGINRAGWVVGQSTRTPGAWDYHGFVFDGEKVYDLSDVLDADNKGKWVITEARGINKKGQIIATGRNLVEGKVKAIVLTPVAR